MLQARIGRLSVIASAAALVAAFSFMLLQSADFTAALFIVGFAMLMLLVEPFLGLFVYILFVYIAPQSYFPALSSLRVMLVIGSAAFASMLLRNALDRQALVRLRSPQDYLMIWFFVAVVVSHLAQFDLAAAADSAYNIFSHIILYFLLVNLVTTKKRLTTLLAVVVVGASALAVQGVIQHALGTGIFEGQEIDKGRIAGVGQFSNPNMLAIGLVTAIPIAFVLMRRSMPLLKIMLFAVVLLLVYALYLTNSRAGMLSLGVVAAVPLVMRLGWVRGGILSAVVFAVVIVFGPSRMAEISTTEASAHARMLSWDISYRIFGTSPLFGIGADAWATKYQTLVAHNSFLHCAAELGVFGLLPWVLLLFISIRNLWYAVVRAAPGTAGIRGNLAGLLTGLLAFVAASFFISKTYSALLFLLLGLSAAATNIFVDTSEDKFELMTRKDVALGVAVMVLGLVVFKSFLMLAGV